MLDWARNGRAQLWRHPKTYLRLVVNTQHFQTDPLPNSNTPLKPTAIQNLRGSSGQILPIGGNSNLGSSSKSMVRLLQARGDARECLDKSRGTG
jgi:hypothetical protein